jgi:hypothetical protein
MRIGTVLPISPKIFEIMNQVTVFGSPLNFPVCISIGGTVLFVPPSEDFVKHFNREIIYTSK